MAEILVNAGYCVITYDPPGAFRSTRSAQVIMSEMLDCSEETVNYYNINEPIPVIGHSMGGLCATAYTLFHAKLVQKLVLIGTVSGGPAIARCKGMPWGMKRTGLDFWRFIFWGWRLSSGLGNLALHKKLVRLIWNHSYANRELIPELEIYPGDDRIPAPIRDRWPLVARKLDYCQRLKNIQVPTLVCVGRFDPQAPVGCSEELKQNIQKSNLVIFEQSGHYPFIEERERFVRELLHFWLPKNSYCKRLDFSVKIIASPFPEFTGNVRCG